MMMILDENIIKPRASQQAAEWIGTSKTIQTLQLNLTLSIISYYSETTVGILIINLQVLLATMLQCSTEVHIHNRAEAAVGPRQLQPAITAH